MLRNIRFFRNLLPSPYVVPCVGIGKAYIQERQKEVMVMCAEHEICIENPRNHPPATVNALRGILSAGTQVTPDPKRPNFYEVEDESIVYYIHVYPASGKVLLLATWPSESFLARLEKTA